MFAGVELKNILEETALTSLSIFTLLGLGFVFGLKHATEADHIVAVSTIVTQERSLLRSSLVGALWGIGHTVALIFVGILVLAFRVAVPEMVAHWLEFGVALMIIGLGLSALVRVRTSRRRNLHLHKHNHDGVLHAHMHFHERETAAQNSALHIACKLDSASISFDGKSDSPKTSS